MVDTAYFNSLSAALEVKTRTRAVNDKITYAAEVQSVLRQLLHEVRFLCAIRKSMVPNVRRHLALVWNLSLSRSSQSRLSS